MPNLIEGRIALITGASRGIGRTAALALASGGCDVGIVYQQQKAAAEEVLAEVRARGRRGIVVQADISSPAEVERMAAQVESGLGPVDILVNNAGVGSPMPLAEVGMAEWSHAIAVNLTSSFLVSQRFVPAMRRRQWGRLLFVSSVAAQTGGVIGPHYAASKAGMIGLMHSYANLLAKEGITANAVAPALIETEMIRGNPCITPALIPVGRFGTADETARAVVFLAENAYITGQTLNVNGGWYMS